MLNYEFTDDQKENLLQWATWLEGTPLTQGREALLRINKEGEHCYCCLGIYAKYKYPEKFSMSNYISDIYYFGDGYEEYLPDEVADEVGLLKPMDCDIDLQHVLAELNDTYGFTFKDIAVEIRHLVETGTITEKAYRAMWED